MIDFYVSGQSIDVGRQGENLARNIIFSLTDLIEDYGNGTATLVCLRPSDQVPYVCETSQNGDLLTWTPTSTDTAYAGGGKCELRWVVGETLAKSIVYNTTILPSITGAEGVPSPYQSWYDAIIAYIEANYAANGAPQEVREAIYALLSKAAYTETGLTDELAIVQAWTAETISVTNNLTHVTNSNTATMAEQGGSYTGTLTADSGYVLGTVTVTMGGEDVTETVYSSGTITIPSVTGDIVITATAVPEVGSHTITYNLTNVISSNIEAAVSDGDNYASVLTADTGYSIGNVTITMGEVDITSTAYNSGNVSIASVSGDVTITAVGTVIDTRTLIHSYDFTQSINDTVGTLTPTLGNSDSGASPAQTSEGLNFNASSQYCSFGTMALANREFEIDIYTMSVQTTNQHTRVFMCTPYASQGTGALIYRQGSSYNYWSGYSGSTWSSPYSTTLARNALAGKTVKLKFDGSGYCGFYLDGELIGTSTVAFTTGSDAIVSLGGLTSGTSYSNNMTITGFRIYEVAA